MYALLHPLDYIEIFTDIVKVDYKTTTSRAWSVLLGLGFTKEVIEGPYSNLSGGWKSRCALASALLMGSDVLLLDEPSNFLVSVALSETPNLIYTPWLGPPCHTVARKIPHRNGSGSNSRLNVARPGFPRQRHSRDDVSPEADSTLLRRVCYLFRSSFQNAGPKNLSIEHQHNWTCMNERSENIKCGCKTHSTSARHMYGLFIYYRTRKC